MAEANLGIKPHGAIVDDAFRIGRRTFPKASAGLGAAWTLTGNSPQPRATRPAPSRAAASHYLSSGWFYRNIHVGPIPVKQESRGKFLRIFISRGDAIIDLSPTYGLSEEVIGHCLAQLETKSALSSATNVWTPERCLGISQMENSACRWHLLRFDLMHFHNLADWQTHVETLKRSMAKSKVR